MMKKKRPEELNHEAVAYWMNFIKVFRKDWEPHLFNDKEETQGLRVKFKPETSAYFENLVWKAWNMANKGTFKYHKGQNKVIGEILLPSKKECWSETLTRMIHRKATAVDASKVTKSNVLDDILRRGWFNAKESYNESLTDFPDIQWTIHFILEHIKKVFIYKVQEIAYVGYGKQIQHSKNKKLVESLDAKIGSGKGDFTSYDLNHDDDQILSTMEKRSFEDLSKIIADDIISHIKQKGKIGEVRLVTNILYWCQVGVANKENLPIIEDTLNNLPVMKKHSKQIKYKTTHGWQKEDAEEIIMHINSQYPEYSAKNDPSAHQYLKYAVACQIIEKGKKIIFSQKKSENPYANILYLLEDTK